MMFSFTGTIANWITDDWKLVERVIDFHPIQDVGIYNFKLMPEDSRTFGLLICHDTWIFLGTLVEYSRYIL